MSGYVRNAALMSDYNAAQQKYAEKIRESDRVILRLIELAAPKSLLDIGCSTGNLLLHINRAFPEIKLTGGDLSKSSLDMARGSLPNVDLREMDMLDIRGTYDCIVSNVVTFGFDWDAYESALASVARALNRGGTYISFEWVHLHQDIAVTETTEQQPEGMTVYFRNQGRVHATLRNHGLHLQRVWPFAMPFDLPMPVSPTDLTSHTKTLANGERLCFRGVLYQPWCHIVAGKS